MRNASALVSSRSSPPATISRSQYDAAVTAARSAAARRDAAAEALRLLREGRAPEQVAAARAEVETARGALAAGVATRTAISC